MIRVDMAPAIPCLPEYHTLTKNSNHAISKCQNTVVFNDNAEIQCSRATDVLCSIFSLIRYTWNFELEFALGSWENRVDSSYILDLGLTDATRGLTADLHHEGASCNANRL